MNLICGDVLEELKKIADESVDVVFADPPFNVGVRYSGYTDSRNDYYEWCALWIDECFRILKPTGSFYLMTITRHLPQMYLHLSRRGVFINQISWKNVASANDKRSFWNATQPILLYGKTDKYKFNHLAQTRKTIVPWNAQRKENMRGQLLDYWDDIPYVYSGSIHHPEAVLVSGENKKAHPAQMPIALPRRAILFSSDVADVVLDPFAGSFTTALACLETGRDFIGIEQSAYYVDLGIERVNKFELQPNLIGEIN